MNTQAFGASYFLDEKSFAERMTQAHKETETKYPWRMEEILAIQRQMRSSEDRLFEYVRQIATPDPLETLRHHIEEMIESQGLEQ
jgi:hypothetical protein